MLSTNAFIYFKEYKDNEQSLTYPSERLVETVSASVTVLEGMMAEVAHTYSLVVQAKKQVSDESKHPSALRSSAVMQISRLLLLLSFVPFQFLFYPLIVCSPSLLPSLAEL
jgi:hypothetical protein